MIAFLKQIGSLAGAAVVAACCLGIPAVVDCLVEEFMLNPRTEFCRHVKHFTLHESATEFSRKSPGRYVMTIEKFREAAQWLYDQI